MKNIKLFKFKDTNKFEDFLSAYDYSLKDVKGFSFDGQEQYCGNILKWYKIYFNDDEHEYFKVVTFKSFNEYHQARLGFKGAKLEEWFQEANIKTYKLKGF